MKPWNMNQGPLGHEAVDIATLKAKTGGEEIPFRFHTANGDVYVGTVEACGCVHFTRTYHGPHGPFEGWTERCPEHFKNFKEGGKP